MRMRMRWTVDNTGEVKRGEHDKLLLALVCEYEPYPIRGLTANLEASITQFANKSMVLLPTAFEVDK